jgi:hypothetical protein
MTLVEEADFTFKNAKLFALGMTQKVRKAELNRVKKLRDSWKKKKREAAAYAQKLMEGKSAKKPGFLKSFSLESARGDLPVRYLTNCKGLSVPVAQLAATNNGTMLMIPHHDGDKNIGGKGVLVKGQFVVKLDKKKNFSGSFKSISFRECKKHKRGKKKGKCNKLFKTEFKKKNSLPSFDAPMKKANAQYGDVSLASCSLQGGSKTYKIDKYFKKFGSGSEVRPKGKGSPLKGLVCDLSKKIIKKTGKIQCEVRFGNFDNFVNTADLAVEKDGKKARKNRKKKLQNRAKKGRKKAKKKKGVLSKFFGKKAKGKKTKAKRGKKGKKKSKKAKKKGKKAKKKAKKSCKKKCKKKKGKKRKSCLKKCK